MFTTIEQLEKAPTKDLVTFYNANNDKPVSRFTDRDAAIKRCVPFLNYPSPSKKEPGVYRREPKAEVKPCRENSNQALAIDFMWMNSEAGVTIDDLYKYIIKHSPRSPKRQTIAATISWDLCTVKGYGFARKGDRYFILLPKGIETPPDHTPLKNKPAATE